MAFGNEANNDGQSFFRKSHNRRRPSGGLSQQHAFGLRPHVLMIAEPDFEQPQAMQPPSMVQDQGDFFTDTFGQEMALSMQRMEQEMQQQMQSMDRMHKQLEERLKRGR